jgi:hypothetical protein
MLTSIKISRGAFEVLNYLFNKDRYPWSDINCIAAEVNCSVPAAKLRLTKLKEYNLVEVNGVGTGWRYSGPVSFPYCNKYPLEELNQSYNDGGLFPTAEYIREANRNFGGAQGLMVINGFAIECKGIDKNTSEYVLKYNGHAFGTASGGTGENNYKENIFFEHNDKCIYKLSYEELYALHLADSIC